MDLGICAWGRVKSWKTRLAILYGKNKSEITDSGASGMGNFGRYASLLGGLVLFNAAAVSNITSSGIACYWSEYILQLCKCTEGRTNNQGAGNFSGGITSVYLRRKLWLLP